MGLRGPQKIPIDMARVDDYARYLSSLRQIALALGVDEATLSRRICEAHPEFETAGQYISSLSETTQADLRKLVVEKARAGESAMLRALLPRLGLTVPQQIELKAQLTIDHSFAGLTTEELQAQILSIADKIRATSLLESEVIDAELVNESGKQLPDPQTVITPELSVFITDKNEEKTNEQE